MASDGVWGEAERRRQRVVNQDLMPDNDDDDDEEENYFGDSSELVQRQLRDSSETVATVKVPE